MPFWNKLIALAKAVIGFYLVRLINETAMMNRSVFGYTNPSNTFGGNKYFICNDFRMESNLFIAVGFSQRIKNQQ
jgi:hypothetical protein